MIASNDLNCFDKHLVEKFYAKAKIGKSKKKILYDKNYNAAKVIQRFYKRRYLLRMCHQLNQFEFR